MQVRGSFDPLRLPSWTDRYEIDRRSSLPPGLEDGVATRLPKPPLSGSISSVRHTSGTGERMQRGKWFPISTGKSARAKRKRADFCAFVSRFMVWRRSNTTGSNHDGGASCNSLMPLIGSNVAQETTRSQALRFCLGTHCSGGSCLLSSQTKDAFRQGGASRAL